MPFARSPDDIDRLVATPSLLLTGKVMPLRSLAAQERVKTAKGCADAATTFCADRPESHVQLIHAVQSCPVSVQSCYRH